MLLGSWEWENRKAPLFLSYPSLPLFLTWSLFFSLYTSLSHFPHCLFLFPSPYRGPWATKLLHLHPVSFSLTYFWSMVRTVKRSKSTVSRHNHIMFQWPTSSGTTICCHTAVLYVYIIHTFLIKLPPHQETRAPPSFRINLNMTDLQIDKYEVSRSEKDSRARCLFSFPVVKVIALRV